MGAEELTGSAVAAYFTSALIQWMKNAQMIQWMDCDTEKVNRIVSAVAAIIVSLGVHVTFDSQAGVLQVSGLLAGSMWSHAGEAIRQYVFQDILYKGVIARHAATKG